MSNPFDKFQEAKLKVEWAQSHIHKLVAQYCTILDLDLAKLSIESDGRTGKHMLRVSDREHFPSTIALIIGDAVHNLRTAFDYITIAVTGNEEIALPVGRTRNDIVSKSRQYRTINDKCPKLATFILDEIQPYLGGKFMLWELSELDRLDKHRLILPTIQDNQRIGVVIEDESGKTFTNQWLTSSSSNASRTLDSAGPFKIKDKGRSAVTIRFGPETPLQDVTVLETLSQMHDLALQAIEAFELFCLGKVSDPNAIV